MFYVSTFMQSNRRNRKFFFLFFWAKKRHCWARHKSTRRRRRRRNNIGNLYYISECDRPLLKLNARLLYTFIQIRNIRLEQTALLPMPKIKTNKIMITMNHFNELKMYGHDPSISFYSVDGFILIILSKLMSCCLST